MRIRIAVPEEHLDPSVIDAALEAVTRLDESLIRSGQAPTSHELIKQGAVWRPEPPGDEHFDHAATIAQRGWADCDDWAPAHAGTLRATGEDPGAIARVFPSGPSTYHAVVQRSDGRIEDPSVAAGMKPISVVGGAQDGFIQVMAIDPHDGRMYSGQLAPTVGPLSAHCGPCFSVRGAMLEDGPYYEARCDVPISGSPLMHVKSYWRRKPKQRSRVRGSAVIGCVPYAFSVVGHGYHPLEALTSAITGAVLCGDAADMTTSLDRYKLLAIEAGLKGMSAGQVRDALVRQITKDVHEKAAATGTHPAEHTAELVQQLAATGVPPPPKVIGDLFGDIAHIASSVVSTVSHVVNDVGHALGQVPWGAILSTVESVVSAVPGLGTAVSDVLAAAETAYESAAALLSGHPIEAAIDAAYNFALASVPGAAALRLVLDPVKAVLIGLVDKKEPIESALLDGIIADVPDAPKFGPISPRTIAATIGKLIASKLGVKNTGTAQNPQPGAQTHPNMPKAAPAPRVVRVPPNMPPRLAFPAHPGMPFGVPAAPRRRPPPPQHPLAARILAAKPLGLPHSAVHVDMSQVPGSPGAPPGATHWVCTPLPNGQQQCRWV